MVKYSGKKLNRYSMFDVVNTVLVVFITLLIMYPLYFCVIASLSEPSEVAMGHTFFWIKGLNLEAWTNVINESRLWVGYRNSFIYTICATLYNVALTLPLAYALSKNYVPFRNLINMFFFITMYVSGGLIPTYLLMKSLHLVNNPLVLVVGACGCYHIIITRQYFSNSIDQQIYEAAYIDGASEMKAFTRIALPLAKPIIAVEALYFGVGTWNSYYSALIYIYKDKWKPLQSVLRDILINNQEIAQTGFETAEEMADLVRKAYMAQSMKY